MKRIVAVCLTLVMLLSMTACGAQSGTVSEASVVGAWKCEIDYAQVVNSFIAENEVLSVSGASLDSAPVNVTYTFGEDGTVTCELDQQQFYAGLTELLTEILTPVIAALGGGMTIEEYMTSSNMNEEEMLYSLFSEELVKKMDNVLSFTGTYTVQGDQLSVTAGGHTSTAKIAVSGDTMTIDAPVGAANGEAQQAALKVLFPLTLTKVQ